MAKKRLTSITNKPRTMLEELLYETGLRQTDIANAALNATVEGKTNLYRSRLSLIVHGKVRPSFLERQALKLALEKCGLPAEKINGLDTFKCVG